MLIKVKEEFGMMSGFQLMLMDTKSHHFKDGKFEEKSFWKNKTDTFRFRHIFRNTEF